MKVWASATAIGLSMAPFIGCSSPPPDGTTPNVAGQSSTGQGGSGAGTNTSAGAQGVAGSGTVVGTGGTNTSGNAGAGQGGGSAGTSTVATGGASPGEGPCPAGVLGHCDAGVTAASYPTYPGYTLALVEDFPAPIDLDNDPILTWSDGSVVDGQTRFRKEQISFVNGKMVFTADSPCAPMTSDSNCIPAGTSYAEPALNMSTGPVGKMGVWSGEVRSKYNNYRYGRYEAKFHAPSANPGHETDPTMAGDFISTLFAFRTPKWATWNEVDYELEPDIPTKVAGNVLNVMGRTVYPMDKNDAWTSSTGLPTGYKDIDEHVYAFTWTPTEVAWFVDGAQVESFAGNANVPIPTLSAKIMMNLWVFSGNAFGDGAQNKYPFSSEYEYFHFYKLDTETTYPCSPTPSCLTASDKMDSQNNPSEVNYGM